MTCFVPRMTQPLAERTQFPVSVAALLGHGLLDNIYSNTISPFEQKKVSY